MIVGLAPNAAARAQYENDFVDKLANHGVLSVASINVVPELENIDRKTVESWLAEYKLDGVIVTRVNTTKPARHYVPPHDSLSGWYGAWAAESRRAPRKEKFFLETDLFDAKTEELLYSAVVETKIKDDRTEPIHAVIDQLAADMVRARLFPRPLRRTLEPGVDHSGVPLHCAANANNTWDTASLCSTMSSRATRSGPKRSCPRARSSAESRSARTRGACLRSSASTLR